MKSILSKGKLYQEIVIYQRKDNGMLYWELDGKMMPISRGKHAPKKENTK